MKPDPYQQKKSRQYNVKHGNVKPVAKASGKKLPSNYDRYKEDDNMSSEAICEELERDDEWEITRELLDQLDVIPLINTGSQSLLSRFKADSYFRLEEEKNEMEYIKSSNDLDDVVSNLKKVEEEAPTESPIWPELLKFPDSPNQKPRDLVSLSVKDYSLMQEVKLMVQEYLQDPEERRWIQNSNEDRIYYTFYKVNEEIEKLKPGGRSTTSRINNIDLTFKKPESPSFGKKQSTVKPEKSYDEKELEELLNLTATSSLEEPTSIKSPVAKSSTKGKGSQTDSVDQSALQKIDSKKDFEDFLDSL